MDWADICRGIQADEEPAKLALYDVLCGSSGSFRARALRRIGDAADDEMHEVYIIAVAAIQRGDVRQPERLAGFLNTIQNRRCLARIAEMMEHRNRLKGLDDERWQKLSDVKRHWANNNPEARMIEQDCRGIVDRALRKLNPQDQEILIRFYVYEQPESEIRAAMRLTETQFRLNKSRALGRFGAAGRRLLKPALRAVAA